MRRPIEPGRADLADPRRRPGGRGAWPAALALAAVFLGGNASASEQPRPAASQTSPGPRAGSVALEFPRNTGAALFRRGDAVLAVFDSPDLRNPEALLRHPALAGAVQVRTLPQGTVLVLPAGSAPAFGLARGPSGWVLGASSGASPSVAEAGAGGVSLDAAPGPAPGVAIGSVPPSRVVVMRDPESDLPLLVGTTREPGRASAGGRRAPEYDLLQTELGVAVLARSESLQLRALPDRFLLSGSALTPLSLDAAAVAPPAAGATLTRCLGLPDLQPERLLARLRSQSALLAGTEPLARATRRRDLAATMLALGMAHEAQAEMNRAAAEDADGAAAPEGRALAAAAALVAGRVEEASAAFRGDGAALADCDEAALWRSLFLAQAGDPAATLPGLRAALPVLRSYPSGLRGRLLPLVADAFARAEAWPALRALLAEDAAKARSPLAAAMLAEADGNADDALAGYDAVARGRDRKARSVALRRAVELRLRTGAVDHAAAARAYGAVLVAWRGDAAERDARTRLAQLLALSGDPGGALALLRQTAALFPDRAAALRQEAGRVVRNALDGAGSTLAAAAAFQAGSDFLPPEDRGVLEARLVHLLLALDLPARASALLAEAAARAPAGETRAEIGWRLAALRAREDDPAGARTALASTDAPDLPEALRARRAALAAEIAERRAGSARPEPDASASAAAEAAAALGRRDWAAAAPALRAHLDARLPAAPAALDGEQQDAVLRLAAILTLAGDDAAVAALRERVSGRMGEGPRAEAFARLVPGPARLPAASAAGAKAAAGLDPR